MDHLRHADLVRQFASCSVVVLGDLMMDEYLWGRATRISPESPVMVVEVDRETSVPGGAANVVNNLLSLGARVAVAGVVGEDEAGQALVAALRERGAEVSGIVVDSGRPTTRKTRIVAHHQQVMRVDRERAAAIEPALESRVMSSLRRLLDSADALVVSDYSKGVVTPGVARYAVDAGRAAGRIVTANPKPRSADSLRGASLVQLNEAETEAATGGVPFASEHDLEARAMDLARRLQVEALVVTRGARGLSLYGAAGACRIPARPVEVYDVAGAGDTVISALTLALACGADIREAGDLANHAAACVVRKLGVATVTPQELLDDWDQSGQ